MSDQECLITLESIICIYIKPTFLAMEIDEFGHVQIVISALEFRNMNIQERVNYVFSLLSTRASSIIKERLCIISAFNGDEMVEVIGHVFEEENGQTNQW